MTTQNARAFNDWLRTQLKAKKMSQRQLAQQSGVDHSTISRLIRGDRMPSLGTATKLARGWRELREDADTTQHLGLVAGTSANPTARVEYGLRADELLSEAQESREHDQAKRHRQGLQAVPVQCHHGVESCGSRGPSSPRMFSAGALRLRLPRTVSAAGGRSASARPAMRSHALARFTAS